MIQTFEACFIILKGTDIEIFSLAIFSFLNIYLSMKFNFVSDRKRSLCKFYDEIKECKLKGIQVTIFMQ